MRKLITVLALGLVTAPFGAFAQSADNDENASAAFGTRGMADPAGRVLALGEELELTAEQIAQLEAIQTRHQATNEPLLAQLREAMPEDREHVRPRGPRAEGQRGDRERMRTRGGPRGRMSERREHMATLRPVMRELRENRRETAAEVAGLLTPEQQEMLDARRDQRRDAMRRGMREQR